jgi:hypothetical protein
MTRNSVYAAAGAGALVAIVFAATSSQAHKAITSPYMYNQDVFPIMRERCARCHYEGGPTPMSLTTHKDAVPWAQSMTEHLISEKMPPWFVDPLGPAVRGGFALPSKELDVLMTWAVGGTPPGPLGTEPPPVPPPPVEWKAGAPDLEIKMDKPHTVASGTIEENVEYTLNTNLKQATWVRMVDLQPGDRSMLRDAVVTLVGGPVLAAWSPGYEPIAPPSGAAFHLPAGAKLQLALHYKKNWQDEEKAKEDRSTIALYFTDAPLSGRPIQTHSLEVPGSDASSEAARPRIASSTMAAGGRVVAIRPTLDQPYATVTIDGITPPGRRVPLLRLRAPQPQWHRRYWLVEPIELPKGSKIEVVATPHPPDDFGITAPKRYELTANVDYVPQ